MLNRSLSDYKKNIYSQGGEDGVIDKIFEIIHKWDNWCVEFGAADGEYLSNTKNLIQNKGYSAVLIEGDKKEYNNLEKYYYSKNNVIAINKYIDITNNSIDKILEKTPIPINFDFLSIDIDGNDYYIWESLNHYKPKVICIEFNPTIPNEVHFVQPYDPKISQGTSLLPLIELAARKGYKLVSILSINAFFVKEEYYHLFGMQDNSLVTLRKDLKAVTYLFSGFDGKIILSGSQKLPWHRIQINNKKVQILPAILQKYPPRYNILEKLFYYIYMLIYAPKIMINRLKDKIINV